MCGPTSLQSGRDLAGERAVGRLQEPAAEDDLHRLLRQLEAGERGPGESDDLVGEARDDRCGNGVVGRLGEDEPRQLDHPAPRDLLVVDRLRQLERARKAEVGRDGVLEARPRAAPVLAPGRRRDRRHADVVAATPVARDLAERGEADLAAVGRDADAVDPGAADDGDAPAALGAGAEDGEGVVADGDTVGPAALADDRVQRILLGREVDAGHAQDADLGDRPVRDVEARLLDRLVEQPLEHVEAARQDRGGAAS